VGVSYRREGSKFRGVLPALAEAEVTKTSQMAKEDGLGAWSKKKERGFRKGRKGLIISLPGPVRVKKFEDGKERV